MTELTAEAFVLPRQPRVPAALRRLARQRLTLAALAVLLVLIVLAAFARRIAPYNWDSIDLSLINHGPTFAGTHVLGTDQVGRDVLTRTLYGLQTTVEIGTAAAALATALGIVLGAAAGFYRGWLDLVLMRIVDLVTVYPAIMLTLAAIVYFYPVYPHTLILILGVYASTFVARVVRADVAETGVAEYVDAARALGASDARIFGRHVLPNIAGTVVVAATAVLGQVILLDATIEFFSYGMPASKWPSLGNLLADVTNSGGLGVSDYEPLGWWTWGFAALALSLLLVCVNVVGDGLDVALNPRRR